MVEMDGRREKVFMVFFWGKDLLFLGLNFGNEGKKGMSVVFEREFEMFSRETDKSHMGSHTRSKSTNLHKIKTALSFEFKLVTV